MSPGDLKPGRRQSEVFLQKRLSDGLLIGDFIAMFNIILLTMAISAILPGTSRSAMPMRQEEMRQKSRIGESDTAAPNKSGGLE